MYGRSNEKAEKDSAATQSGQILLEKRNLRDIILPAVESAVVTHIVGVVARPNSNGYEIIHSRHDRFNDWNAVFWDR